MELTKGKKNYGPIVWTEEAIKSFEEIKKILAEDAIDATLPRLWKGIQDTHQLQQLSNGSGNQPRWKTGRILVKET